MSCTFFYHVLIAKLGGTEFIPNSRLDLLNRHVALGVSEKTFQTLFSEYRYYKIELKDVDLAEIFKEIRARSEKDEIERTPYGLEFSQIIDYLQYLLDDQDIERDLK